jgi:hypothetical protein
MRGQIIELERLDMRQRSGSLKAGNAGNRRMRTQVQEDPLAGKNPRTAVVQVHFDGLRRDETPASQDQLGTTGAVVVQMQFDLAVDHVALALADRRHVGLHRTGHRAELSGVVRQMRHLGAPNLVLAGHAGDIGTGAADPAALDDGSPPPRLRHVPCQQLAALAAAQDQDFNLFCRHELSPSLFSVMGKCPGADFALVLGRN